MIAFRVIMGLVAVAYLVFVRFIIVKSAREEQENERPAKKPQTYKEVKPQDLEKEIQPKLDDKKTEKSNFVSGKQQTKEKTDENKEDIMTFEHKK